MATVNGKPRAKSTDEQVEMRETSKEEKKEGDTAADEVAEGEQLRAAMLILDVLERESDFYYLGEDGGCP